MSDLGIFVLRATLGGLLMGHGAQKLFGLFEGHGIQATGQHFEKSFGLAPGQRWAVIAGVGELKGGLLTALGFMHPIGPMLTLAPMAVAWGKAHGGKPIWVTSGGAELPATNMAVALALMLTGPGRFSLDRALGTRVRAPLALLVGGGIAAGALFALSQPTPRPEPSQAPSERPAHADPATTAQAVPHTPAAR